MALPLVAPSNYLELISSSTSVEVAGEAPATHAEYPYQAEALYACGFFLVCL